MVFSLAAVFVFIKIDPNLWGHERMDEGSLTIIGVLDNNNSPIYGASSSTHDVVFGRLQGNNNSWVSWAKVRASRLGVINALNNGTDYSENAYFWESTNYLDPSSPNYSENSVFVRMGWGETEGTETCEIHFLETTRAGTTVFMEYNPEFYGTQVWP